MAVAKIRCRFPGFDWVAWARPQGIEKASESVIPQPSFFKGFAAMVPSTPMTTWKAWLAAQVITLQAPLLGKDFSTAAFEFFGKTLSRAAGAAARAGSAASQLVNGHAGRGRRQALRREALPASAPRPAWRRWSRTCSRPTEQSITDPRLDDARDQEGGARQARASSRPKIGYPDKWRDYSQLDDRRRTTCVGNVRARRASSRTTTSSRSSASPSTATSG